MQGLRQLLRRRHRDDGTRSRIATDLDHLDKFLQTRSGVEAFVEPQTTVTDTTVLLVAGDGEWTRRRVGGPRGAVEFARKQAIPMYDVTVIGYPARMREFNERRKLAEGQ